MKLHFSDILGIIIIILATIGIICFIIGIAQILIYTYWIKNRKYDIDKKTIMRIKVKKLKEGFIYRIPMLFCYIVMLIFTIRDLV